MQRAKRSQRRMSEVMISIASMHVGSNSIEHDERHACRRGRSLTVTVRAVQ